MGNWSFNQANFTSTAANTFEYSGISVTVPASQLYEFVAQDQRISTDVLGIIVCDSMSSITIGGTIAENSASYTAPTNKVWVRQVAGITASHDATNTYYVWVKRGSASSGLVRLAYRRIR